MPGAHSFLPERIQEILELPDPTIRKQLRAFLGLTGYCRLWIPNYGLKTRLLHNSLKGKDDSTPLNWGPHAKRIRPKIQVPSCSSSGTGTT